MAVPNLYADNYEAEPMHGVAVDPKNCESLTLLSPTPHRAASVFRKDRG